MTSLTEENIIVTFCYPASTKHLKKFIFSINSQKYKKFNLIFFTNNYSIENKYLNKITNKYLIYKLNGSPSLVRQMAIKKILNLKPKKICFADLDDNMDKERALVVFKLLNKNAIVVNDINLHYVWKKKFSKRYFSNYLKNNQKLNYRNILNSNFIGFTNSAVRFEVLKQNKNKILINKKIRVYDWFLWSILTIKNNAIFTNRTVTQYNIFKNSKNKIPPSKYFKSIYNLIVVKKNHYDLMSSEKKVYKVKNLIYKNFLDNFNFRNKKQNNFNSKLNFNDNFWWSICLKDENKT
tara:strand:- start:3925 stop:4806 length:882 start_codon:yes stop_codon:yes gene_type:complete